MSGGYELHQKLRTKAVRQLKKKDYDGAINSLYDGSRQLLEAKEQGSGCDLACYLVDVYSQANKPSDSTNRQRITTLLELAAPDFWRKKIIDAAVKWSIAVTNTPAGDGFLRLAIAEIVSKSGDYYASEAHFIAACTPPPGLASASDLFPANAPKAFACMMLDWLAVQGREAVEKNGGKGETEGFERVVAGAFALRGLIPLLLARSITSARGFLSIFVSRLVSKHPKILLPVQPNPKPFTPPGGSTASGEAQQLYLTANPELNFAQMAMAMTSQAVEHKKRTRGSRVPDTLRDGWIAAVRQFERESEEDEEDDFLFQVLPQLSQIYFDVQPPRGQGGNFMQDMLGSLMGGGGSGDSSSKGATPAPIRRAPPPRLPLLEGGGKEETSTGDSTAGEELDLD
ncbi:hypothetical protein CBS101457_004649 [Exobasidium rhododendri]|nr:hypothetical protein CBS101457_004649 [Exobasidium rhododendri]